MAKPNVTIRQILQTDLEAWQTMWEEYLAFYKQNLPPEATSATWDRFFDSSCPMYCLVAEDKDNRLLGFAAHVVHPGTWGTGNACYLEDLYVAPHARCMGVARKMIGLLVDTGKHKSWYRIYWHTDGENHTARALYDKIGVLTDRVKYDIELS